MTVTAENADGDTKFGASRRAQDGRSDADFLFDANVLSSLRTLTAWFAALMLAFAFLDPWVLRGADRAAVTAVSMTAVIIAVLLALISLWLRLRPPPTRWASAVAFIVGSIGLVRATSYVIANPRLIQVQLLLTLIIAAGCIFLSRSWFVTFITFATIIWYATAYKSDPSIDWHSNSLVTASAVAIAAVVFVIRRRSVVALMSARELDRLASAELAGRVLRGELLARVSSRFLALPEDGLDEAAENILRELGETVGVDHAFLCRVDDHPLRTSVIHEWAAPGRTLRKTQVQNVPLDVQPWFCRQFLAGEVTQVSDATLLPDGARVEREILASLGTRAFLASPLLREHERPWGYLGFVQDTGPREWSVDDVNLIRTIGAILLSALDRQRAERAVRRSEERFRRLFEAELIGMFFADMYGNITETNDSFLKITGFEPGDLPLKSEGLTPPEWRGHDEAALLRLFKEGIDRPREKEFFHKDGHRIPILIGGAVMTYDRGESVFFILDLTDQKRAEQKIHQLNSELERTARLGVMGEMAAGLAHEVHQPLAAISNYATGARERLARGRLSEDDLDHVFAEIAEQCGCAGSVIRNIREFVSNRNPVSRPVDLNAVARECLRLLRFEIRQREVVIHADLAEPLPLVLTDRTQMSQVLINLMLNGLQAMEGTAQPRTLSVKTCQADGAVLVEVADTGCGIEPDVESRLFDQFFTTKPDGLGMGLPISRSIVESHGGRLELANTGASGSTFVLRLPAASGQEASDLSRSPHDAAMS